ncbi:MAG: DEAD/DEAH box helicase family protein, partial [Lentisphaeria bacterium]
MKLNFKKMDYQLRAVESVVDCFDGQPKIAGLKYRMDPGISQKQRKDQIVGQGDFGLKEDYADSFKNATIRLTEEQLLKNIQKVQERQNLPLSSALVKTKICPVNLDVEMETGTGKTYCYIKSIFELNERFGWSKFIIVVPSI